MAKLTALYDSCVLYPAPLRDLLVRLAGTGLFRARWTNEIHEEWIRNVLESRNDLTRAQLERTRDLMNEHILDCLVTGYEDHISSIVLPDPNDRHVVAAAIAGQADVIVMYNLKDFPPRRLRLSTSMHTIPMTSWSALLTSMNPLCALPSASNAWTSRTLQSPLRRCSLPLRLTA